MTMAGTTYATPSADYTDVIATAASSRSTVVVQYVLEPSDPLGRSFQGVPRWSVPEIAPERDVVSTAASNAAPFIVNDTSLEDPILASITELGKLKSGWDGEDAVAPTAAAVRQAKSFIRALGSRAAALEAALHVDGAVLLEINDGAAGALEFRGDNQIVFAIPDRDAGIVDFNGVSIPERIEQALPV